MWSSNENGGPEDNLSLDIRAASLTVASGPRVVTSTMGPVKSQTVFNLQGTAITFNNQTASGISGVANGTPLASGFVVQFDRPVDPATVNASDILITYRNTSTSGFQAGVNVPVLSVTPLGGVGEGNTNDGPTEFLVQFAPQGGVGTYSYQVGPIVRDRIRTVTASGSVQSGNLMDQNGDAVGGENPYLTPFTGTSPGDVYAVPTPAPTTPTTFAGTVFDPPYSTSTEPLIVPGPSVISTFVPGVTAAPDNLVTDQAVSQLAVVFDRDMNVATVTPASILRIMGPQGQISGPFTVTTLASEGTHNRTFIIGFPSQQLSGTYTVTFAPTIQSSVGDALDTNQNAGLDELRGTSSNGQTTVKTYNSNDASPPVIGGATAGTATFSSINVPDNFIVQGVTLTINLTYPHDTDLTAFLISPSGTKLQLFTGIGSTGNQANFTGTTFSDAATTPIQNGGPPFFSGTSSPFNPQFPLSVFKNQDSGGKWQLEVVDSVATAPANRGTISSWQLNLTQPVSATGLGETVADQFTASFQIFTQDPTNSLSSNTWTSTGSSGIDAKTIGGNAEVSGQVGAIAVDPSDPSGNTVYLGAASGGIWKTTDFLTTSAAGPTWVPLTQFGPTSSLNIGSIAVFPRNNDPNQSIIIAGTGNGDSLADQTPGPASVGSSPSMVAKGVGFLRSMDGGATWTLLDSMTNVDASGNPLPLNSPLRDHVFDNTATFKVVVDPKLYPGINGGVIIYAALSDVDATGHAVTAYGATSAGGIWKSVDSGNHWTKLLPGEATDVLLDQNSGTGESGGNLQIVYAGLAGGTNAAGGVIGGVYRSSAAGAGFLPMTGTAGDTLYQNDDVNPTQPVAVGSSTSEYYPKQNPDTPNSLATAVKGRIVLAKPALTGNPLQDTLYQGWLYAAVVTAATTVTADSQTVFGGHLEGLYLTKDAGDNWTRVQLPTEDTDTEAAANQSLPQIPTNDDRNPGYNPLGNNTPAGVPIPPENDPDEDNNGLGNYAISLAVDPNNPNVVYLGGSSKYDTSGLLRVDTTGIADAHAFYMSNTDPEGISLGGLIVPNDYKFGGQTTIWNNWAGFTQIPVTIPQGPVLDDNPGAPPTTSADNPFSPVYTPYINLIANPLKPFVAGSTILTTTAAEITNDGAKAKWTTFDQALKPSTFDTTASDPWSVPTTNVHQIITMVDPITGKTRLIFGDDNGVFTAVDNGTGTLIGSIGSTGTPSTTSGDVQVPTGSRNGNLSDIQFYYGAAEPSTTAAQASALKGLYYGVTKGDGLVYANSSVISKGQTGYGDPNWTSADNSPSTGNVPRSTGSDVAVVQSNNTGANYGSVYTFTLPGDITNGKVTDFFQLDQNSRTSGLFPTPSAQFDPVARTGIADVPDAEWPLQEGFRFTVNPINGNQVLISSANGTVFSTENGGKFWNVIGQPNDLDGTNAQALTYGAPDPNGPGGVGNQDAYLFAGTISGNIFVTFKGGGANNWINLSSGLDGSPIQQIITNPTPGSHEAYAVTQKGVYHMVNSAAAGAKWVNITANLFSIVEPILGVAANTQDRLLDLTSVQADWRYVIPDSFANPNGSTHPMLYVGGEGGVFRSYDGGLTWTIFPSAANGSLDNTPATPGDGGGLPAGLVTSLSLDTGEINPSNGRANVATGPNSLFASTFGTGTYSIRLAPITFPTTLALDPNNPSPGGSDTGLSSTDNITDLTQPYITGLSEQTAYGNVVTITLYDESVPGQMIPIGTGQTDAAGRFSVQVSTPFATDGVKIIGVQATDQSGTKGNVATFTFTLNTVLPATPAMPVLDAALPAPNGSDSGQARLPATLTDDITNVTSPFIDVTTSNATPGVPIPATSEIFLYSDGLKAPVASRIGPGALHDTRVLTAGVHTYYAVVESVAGKLSQPSATLTITVITKALGPQATAPVLDPASDSGVKLDNITNVTKPTFDVSPVFSPTETFMSVELLRRVDGSTGPFSMVGIADLTSTTTPMVVQDTTGVTTDGKYDYEVEQIDIAGNVSAASPFVVVTIDTTPQGPPLTPVIQPSSVTGPVGSNTTAIINPFFNVTAVDTATFPNVTVELLRKVDGAAASTYRVVGTAPATGNVSVAIQDTLGAVPDGKYDYAADEIDLAGNKSAPSGFTIVTIDTHVPLAPTSLVLDPASDTGVKGDNITSLAKVPSPSFDVVSTEATATVNLYRKLQGAASFPTTPVGTRVGSGVIQDTSPPTADGFYVYTAQEVSSTGIKGAFLATPLTIQFLSVSEGPPLTPVLDPNSDSGVKGDGITNVTNPSFDVTAVVSQGEPASPTMELVRKIDGAPVSSYVIVGGPSAAGLSAVIQDTGPAPTNGVYDYAAIEIDVAGNASAPGNYVAITIQTSNPIQPVLVLSPASDSGVLGDHITNVAQPTFTGTTSPNASVKLYQVVSGGGLLPLGSTTALASGAFIITPTNKFNEGTYTLEAIATDGAGNTGTSLPFPLQILLTPPGTPPAPILDAGSDSGSSSSDDFTNVVAPFFRETASSATTTVQLFRKLQGAATFPTTPIASATGNGSGGYDLIQDAGPVVPPGTVAVYVYAARQVDVAGNVGSFGPSTAVTFDTLTPAAPIPPTLDLSTDSGAVGDSITKVNKNLVMDVTATAPTNTVLLFRQAAGTSINTFVGQVVGSGKVTDSTLLPDGTYNYFTQQVDLAGNHSLNGFVTPVTIKTIAPATPAPFLLLAADDSGLKGDNVTNVGRPRFTGNTTPGASVVLLTATTPISPAVTAAADGSFTLQPSVALGSGVYTLTAQATDVAGNKSLQSQAITLTIDGIPPTVPTISILPSDVTGLPGTNQTTVTRPHFIGTTDPSTKVVLTIGGQTVTGSSDASGNYSLQPTANLAYGVYTAQVQASDVAGNVSTSSALTVTIAATVATTPTIALLASDDSGVPNDNITNVTRPHFVGLAGINLTVNLYTTAGKLLGSTTTNAMGGYSVQPTAALADGTYSVYIQATNASSSAKSGVMSVTIYTQIPAAPAVSILAADDTGVVGDFITAVRQPRFIGTTVDYSTIGLYNVKTGALLASQAVGSTGAFALQPGTALPLGKTALEVIVTDAAGNVGTPSVFQANIIKAAGDFDGDGKTDAAAYDPMSSTFYSIPSSGGAMKTTVFGVPGGVGVPVAGDFDGDGKTDIAEYDQANSTFYIIYSGGGAAAIQLGTTGHGDIPDPADFYGTGKTNVAVFDPTLAQFQIYNPASPTQPTIVPWGIAGHNEIPVPGDFDGDGKTDYAVYDPAAAIFLVDYSSGGSKGTPWGVAGRNEVPVAGDFDGDGKTDYVLYDEGYATMLIDYSSGGSLGVAWGIANRNEVPTFGDYTGNGKTDVAVYDQGYATLLVDYSTGGSQGFPIGQANRLDIPQPTVVPTAGVAGIGAQSVGGAVSFTDFQPLSSPSTSSSVAIAPSNRVRLHAQKKAAAKVKSFLTKAEHAKVVAAKVKVTAHDLALENLWDRRIGE